MTSTMSEEAYRSVVQREHGSIVNPVTGEELDVMVQCISLRVEGGSRELCDSEALEDAVSTFGLRLALRTRVWRRDGDRKESGTIERVNKDGTYDVALDGGVGSSYFARRRGVLRDVSREELETAPLLVLGDPAGGKTTFAKQLVTWTIREHRFLVPVMVRVCDVARFADRHEVSGREASVWAYLRRTASAGVMEVVEAARASKRLVLVLDGLDEAGRLHARLEREIVEEYSRYGLVLTSRDMKPLESEAYGRFRRVRVMQLDRSQIQAIAKKRLPSARAEVFLKQLNASPALRRMAANPLLLSVTLAVFDSIDSQAELNRGLVYAVALDSMLGSLDGDAVRARLLFRRIAYAAHSFDRGKGTRDLDDALVASAVAELGADYAADWARFSAMAQRGRLPLLTWYSEECEDKYRFAHLTFQEFLCAERVSEMMLSGETAATDLRALILGGASGRPVDLFTRGWWQQVVQMLADLAAKGGAVDQKRVVAALCDALLDDEQQQQAPGQRRKRKAAAAPAATNGHHHHPAAAAASASAWRRVALDAAVGDRNAATLFALVREVRGIGELKVTNGGLGASGASTLWASVPWARQLSKLNLSGNLLDPAAASTLAAALAEADPPLVALDVAANRVCVGARREGFESETFHARTKCGGTTRSKLYLDYFHAAFLPDLSGLEALASYAKTASTLRSFDCRSNALTVDAGKLVAKLLLEDTECCRRMDWLCGIDLRALLGGGGDGGGDASSSSSKPPQVLSLTRSEEELRVGDRVEARASLANRFTRQYYAGVVARVERDHVVVGFLTARGQIGRRDRLPKRVVRPRPRPGEPHAAPRLEAGGCYLLAKILARASASARASLHTLDLGHQALACDFSVWNPPRDDISRGRSSSDLFFFREEEEDRRDDDDDDDDDDVFFREEEEEGEDETGVNPAAVLELLEVLRGFPKIRSLDVRDSIDLGARLGAALGEAAVERDWIELGVGSNLLDVRELRRAERARVRKSLKDAGVAAVATVCERATRISASTTAVGSAALKYVMDVAARRPHLGAFNRVDISRLENASRIDLGAAVLDRASARLVLFFLRRGSAKNLVFLDLSNADLMPSCHPHPRTPELFGVGHLCNACATHHALSVDINLACQICDNDACGAAWRSGDIVEDLAAAIEATPHLEYLGLQNTCFTTMDGPVSGKPFRKLARSISRLSRLRRVDLSKNAWAAPRLTRWCAESLLVAGSSGTASARTAVLDDDDDDDDLREQARWRRQRPPGAAYSGSDDDDDDDDDDQEEDDEAAARQDDDRAYSRSRIPLALGWPALSRGLARCPSLDRVRVTDLVDVDVARLAAVASSCDDDDDDDDASSSFVDAADFLRIPTGALSEESSDRPATLELASLVFLVDLFRFSSRVAAPRRLRVDLSNVAPACERRAQTALAHLLPDLDELVIGDLRLPLADLRRGTLDVLRVPPSNQKNYGVLVAAAIDGATNLRGIESRGVNFGDATLDVVEAAERCATLQTLNGVRRRDLGGGITSLDFSGSRIMDAGAMLLAKTFPPLLLISLDLSGCDLSPAGVSAVVSALPKSSLRCLDLSFNAINESATSLATFLTSNKSLELLRLRSVQLARSTSPDLEAFARAIESNSTLLELDLENTDLPEKLAASLSRTFNEKQTTCPTSLPSKLAFLLVLRSFGLSLAPDAISLVFQMARPTRVLKVGARRAALADMFPALSPAARDLVDRMDSGDLDITSPADIHEINAIIHDFSDADTHHVQDAYEILVRRTAAAQGPGPVDDDLETDEEEEDDDDV